MKQNIVVLSGAGISAESGLGTFRDNGGLWERYKIEDVATPDAWARNPDLVRDFYNLRRKEALAAQPNEAHRQLVRLEEKFNVNIVTQNVDALHERAGSTNVLHLHGELNKLCSQTKPDYIVPIEGWEQTKDMKDDDGTPLRPFIVWFGEAVPNIDRAIALCRAADVLIVVGTSLNVYPAAGLKDYCNKGCRKYFIDPKSPQGGLPSGFQHIKDVASQGIRTIVDLLTAE
ncbi:MAG: NAD-dependent deacylase [Bacteroidales bacterium]|jgi:NAD-dependent deacetylase|nr:NAD-dependent deacylase [Bacteroidales bacterium]